MPNTIVNPNFRQAAQSTQDEGKSFSEGVGDFLQYGISSAALSAGLGIYNTGVALVNTFGGEAEEIDTERTLRDSGMYRAADYYQENKTGIDAVGFVAGSFVPGMLGVKALRAGQAALAATKTTARLSTGFKKVLLPDTRVTAMREAIDRNGMDAYAAFQQNKLRTIAAGFQQQALEAAAFEGAVLVSMNQAPTWNSDDLTYFDAIQANLGSAAVGLAFGTGLGGIFDATSNFGKLKGVYDTHAHSSGMGVIKVLQEGQNNAIPLGERAVPIAQSYIAAKNMRSSPEFGALTKGDQANWNTKERAARVALSAALLKVAGDNTQIKEGLLKLIDEGKADPIELLSGVASYRPMYQQDVLYDVPVAQVELMLKDDIVAWANKAIEAAGLDKNSEHAVDFLDRALNNVNGMALTERAGVSMREADSVYAFSSIQNMLDSGDAKVWDNMFVLRHEAGHLLTDYSVQQLSAKSRTMKGILGEAEILSRRARKDKWDYADKIREHEAAGGVLTPEMARHVKYMSSAEELVADAYALISNPNLYNMDSALKEFPLLFKFMVGNKALAGKFRMGKQAIDLKTGKLSPLGISPTAADLSTELKLVKDNVHYGRGEVAKLGEKFDTATVTPLKANALFSVAAQRKDITADTVVDFWDLPTLTAAKAKGLNVNVVRDGVQIRSMYQSLDDLILHSKLETVDKLTRESWKAQDIANVKKGKRPTGLKSFENYNDLTFVGTTVADEAGGRILSTADIARMADVGETFVTKTTGLLKLLDPATGRSSLPAGALDDVRDTPFFSLRPDYDPLQPSHAIIVADRNAVVDGNRIAGEAEGRKRVLAARATVDNTVAGYMKKDYVSLPPNAAQTPGGINQADQVSPTDRTSGLITSANQEVGSGGSFFQYVGTVLSKVMSKKAAEVDAAFNSQKVKLAADETAVMEAAVLDSVLRQAPGRMEYEFIPAKIEDWLDEVEVLSDEALDGLIDSEILKTIFDGADQGNRIWRGEIRQALREVLRDPNMDYESALEIGQELLGTLKNTVQTIKHPGLAKFWQDMVKYNGDEIVSHSNALAAKIGGNANKNPRALYPGPADTTLYPYHALVVANKKGLLGLNETGMLVAKDQADLQRKMADLRSQYSEDELGIFTTHDIKKYKEAEGEYQGSKLFAQNSVNSLLTKKGVMWDVSPQPNPKLFNQYTESLVNQQRRLARSMVEAKYGEEFAALDASSDWVNQFNSKVGKKTKQRNVFSDLKDMALNRRPESSDNIWDEINTITDQAISKVYYGIISAGRMASKTGDWEAMNDVLESYGLRKAYDEANQLLLTNVDAPRSVMAPIVSKMNFVVGTSMLRMDMAHALVNIVSAPIMLQSEFAALQRYARKDRWQVLRDGTSVKIPGTDKAIGSLLPLAHQAIKDFHTKPELVQKFRDRGILTSQLEDMKAAEAEFAKIAGMKDPASINAKLNEIIDLISTPSDQSEQLVKFVSARIADLVTDTLKVPEQMKWATINAFTSRVNGNYIASQRPTLFQGWMGQAVGLFQTYQFNLLQSLFSNVRAGDKKAVASMLGLQAGIFGVQSVPGFQMMNQYIGERSSENNDFYKVSNSVLGETASNWLMYGTASSAAIPVFGNGIDLYSRGDLTPRTPILLPTSPSEVPGLAITGRFFSSVFNMFDRMGDGAPPQEAVLDALAHSGLNRPIMGLAQMWQEERTSKTGQNILDLERVDAWNWITRAIGAKPLDEAVAVNSFYRANAYKAARQASLDDLGDSYRIAVRNDRETPEQYLSFMSEYAARGGDIENFQNWAGRNYLNATQSQIDRLRNSNGTPEGRYLQEIMGGQEVDYLGDFGQ